MHEIPFDDIDAINAAAGGADEENAWSGWGPEVEVTQEMINGFADLTGDHQWIHVDLERAANGPFGAPVAHGFLTLSLLPSLNRTGTIRLTGHQNVVNYGADGLRFLAPVPAGSSLHARNRVKEAREHRKGTLLATQVAIHGVGNDVPAVLYDALVLYQG